MKKNYYPKTRRFLLLTTLLLITIDYFSSYYFTTTYAGVYEKNPVLREVYSYPLPFVFLYYLGIVLLVVLINKCLVLFKDYFERRGVVIYVDPSILFLLILSILWALTIVANILELIVFFT